MRDQTPSHSLLDALPSDWREATLLGRLLTHDGPTPVLVSGGRLRDISRVAPTVSQFLNGNFRGELGIDLGPLEAFDFAPAWTEGEAECKLLSPIDLQCIKAAGVTFAVSAIERVIEERARGEASKAESIRAALRERVGADLRSVKPGSPEAMKLKEALIADGLWSQYLEVAIGPDAEVFTKAPILSSVGWGDYIGVRSDSVWNNPEPEIVLVCNGKGEPVGAALGNDVNLRCFEGRSALLLGKAKDNNASCALGPFIRLFDESFTLDDVRQAVVRLEIHGEDQFRLEGQSSMREISRDPLDLAGQTIGKHHQYPDGFVLFMGTMFAPTEDRDGSGKGFTHKVGDVVRVSSEKLGVLENKVTHCDQASPWQFGVGDLISNLAGRGLLAAKAEVRK
ncbi:fumarylacetoacetate (FAA) hydrolase family protein [Rhizomicrobium palustre]|uniref:Fumarylacetoacetate (FAA) hydrolase family protein n=1 Tax=Rhizomicrobium palustre TaxID=189966 RepID=A0A846MZN0_9PROT|nr:fumarylacetoacetate hydrolase family protein [Rhizomicrobium palustre]NIK89124.1 fumarylacetoacetate (FAA) hydrolase family protein [Rhizomicrobium palustre]